jgi:hypothetical protein
MQNALIRKSPGTPSCSRRIKLERISYGDIFELVEKSRVNALTRTQSTEKPQADSVCHHCDLHPYVPATDENAL